MDRPQSIDSRLAVLEATVREHITGCRADNARATAERAAFRKEMRGYFIALIVAGIALFANGHFHLLP